jgi:hypothetical protein
MGRRIRFLGDCFGPQRPGRRELLRLDSKLICQVSAGREMHFGDGHHQLLTRETYRSSAPFRSSDPHQNAVCTSDT